MAGLYHYNCTDCDFEIYSLPFGGDIYGCGIGYYLYSCKDCKQLTEIKVDFTESAQMEVERAKIKYMPFGGDDQAEHDINVCCYCGSTKLVRWKPEDGCCPICNGKLIRSSEPVIQTD